MSCAQGCGRSEELQTASSCGHAFCRACLEARYLQGGAFACPVCKTALSRASFRTSTFAPASLAKEMKIRRRLAKIYNAEREDFSSTPQYDDYCEQAEDVAYRLVEGDGEAEKEAQAHLDLHAAQVVQRNQRREQRDRRQREVLAQAGRDEAIKEKQAREEEEAEKSARAREREAVLTRVAAGQLAADSMERGLKARVAKRLARDRLDEENMREEKKNKLEESKAAESGGVGKALPRPLGQVAIHETQQASIHNSYGGQLSDEQLSVLLLRCQAAHAGLAVFRKRAKYEQMKLS